LLLQIFKLGSLDRDPVDVPSEERAFMALEKEHQHRSLSVVTPDEFDCLHPRWRDEISNVMGALEGSSYWRNDKNHLDYSAIGAAFEEADSSIKLYVIYRQHHNGAQRRRQFCLPAYGEKSFFKLFRPIAA
jgi:hypothetical protein